MTLKEVANYLKASKTSIYRWIKKRNLPAHKPGKNWRFYKSEIDEWVKNNNTRRK